MGPRSRFKSIGQNQYRLHPGWPFNQTRYRNRGLLSSRSLPLLFFPSPLLPLILLPVLAAQESSFPRGTRDVSLFKIEIYVRPLDGTRWKVKVKSA